MELLKKNIIQILMFQNPPPRSKSKVTFALLNLASNLTILLLIYSLSLGHLRNPPPTFLNQRPFFPFSIVHEDPLTQYDLKKDITIF